MSISWKQMLVPIMLFIIPLSTVFNQEKDCIALVTELHGTVQVKKAGQSGLKNCMWGTQFHNGDIIHTSENGRVSILFSNGNLISLGPSSSMTISSGPSPAKEHGESIGTIGSELAADLSAIIVQHDDEGGFDALAGLRGGPAASEIVLSAPCNTLVDDTRPAFTWTSKKLFESYKVILFDSQGPVWSQETKTTSLAYPEKEKPLVRGASYFWTVEGIDLIDVISSPRIGFSVLTAQKMKTMNQYQARLLKMFDQKNECATYYTIIGTYFEKNGLLADAIEAFRKVAEANPESPLPHEILGRLYRKTGQKDMAIFELDKALRLTKTVKQ